MNVRSIAATAAAVLALSPLVGCGGGGEPESSVDAFCQQLAPLADLGGQIQATDADLAGLSDALIGLTAVAPVAVKPSVETIASALTTMAAAAEASGEQGPAATAAAFAAIEAELEGLERASEVVEGYAARECDLDLTPDASTTDSTATETSDTP